MKKFYCFLLIILLCFGACGTGENTTEESTQASTTFDWLYGGVCAHRNDMMDIYTLIEIDGSDLITSSEGSLVTGYYENQELRIVKIAVYQSRHKVFRRFYPFGNDIVITGEKIIYATGEPLSEVTEEDLRLDAVFRALIKDGQVYCYTDEPEPMCDPGDTWYAEIYEKAVEALDQARTE